ncbi:hypothetical protein [Streptomyces sp. NPDC021562]|uniref:hypothetical protein n=1 Tax=Streptomyces sp. NPDC021562 TaxID=3155121 RepID=UPI00340D3149
MSLRVILLAVLPAGVLGIAAAVAVWLPDGGDLSWTRFLLGCALWLAIQIGGSAALGYLVGRRWGLSRLNTGRPAEA